MQRSVLFGSAVLAPRQGASALLRKRCVLPRAVVAAPAQSVHVAVDGFLTPPSTAPDWHTSTSTSVPAALQVWALACQCCTSCPHCCACLPQCVKLITCC